MTKDFLKLRIQRFQTRLSSACFSWGLAAAWVLGRYLCLCLVWIWSRGSPLRLLLRHSPHFPARSIPYPLSFKWYSRDCSSWLWLFSFSCMSWTSCVHHWLPLADHDCIHGYHLSMIWRPSACPQVTHGHAAYARLHDRGRGDGHAYDLSCRSERRILKRWACLILSTFPSISV